VSELTINDELITSSGALSMFHGAVDELIRRYGMIEGDIDPGSDNSFHLTLEELLPPKGLFLVARRDSHPVGGVGIRPIGEPSLEFAEVKRLWVRPDQRRTGVGEALMRRIQERARGLGYQRLYLETGPLQPEALALYQTSGWEPVDDFPKGAFSYEHAYRFTRAL
jgi:GNAT superfamily N-acetyltransferase